MTLYSRLAAYYPCDNTHGRSLSEDVVGTNDGTVGVASAATGKVRQGMFFLLSGGQFRSVPNDSAIQGLLGVCCWVKFSTLAADMSIVSKGSDGTDTNTSIKLWYDHSDTDLALTVGDGLTSTTINTDGLTLAVDTWYHIRAYNDGNRMGIAVDGTLYGSGTARAPLTETGLLYLGSDFSNNYLDGVIDEVALFSTSPTIADGAALYNGGDGASLPIPDTLPGPSGRAGVGTRWLPPSFAESDDAVSYIAHGKLPVQRFDGTLARAGVEAPDQKVTVKSSGSGDLVGKRYAYLRNLDAEGRVSSVSPISDVHDTFGTGGSAITNATNASPIVITSASHGLATGQTVLVNGQLGNTAANGTWVVGDADTDTFSLNGSVGNGDWLATEPPGMKLAVTQAGSAGTSQVQTLSYSNTPTAGSFVLKFKGEPTTAIAYNASAATIQTALNSLTSIDEDGVLCAGGSLDSVDVTITFQNTMANVDHPILEVDFTGAPSTLSATVTKIGTAGNNEVQTIDLVMLPTGGTFTLTYSGQATGAIAYNASAATVVTALEALSNIAASDLTGGGGSLPGSPVTIEFGGTLAETNVAQMTVDGSSLTGTAITVGVSTTTPGVGPSAVWPFNSNFVDDVQGITFTQTGGSGPTIDTSTKHLGAGSVKGGSSYDHLTVSGLTAGSLPSSDEDFSIACWVRRTTSWNNPSRLISLNDGVTPAIAISLVTTGSIRAVLGLVSAGDNTAFASSVVSTNTWTHLAVVHDATAKTLKIYADGSLQDTATYTSLSGSIDTDEITFLYDALTGTNVDELSIWPLALSSGNVASLYNSGTGEEAPYTPEVNEVQAIAITGSPSAGAFTLTYSGQTTESLAYNASASQVDAALENLSNIASGDVTSAGGPLPGTAVDVEFTGNLAGTNVAEMTATASSSPSVAISTTSPGGGGAWTLSGGSYSSNSYDHSTQDAGNAGLDVKSDGTAIYMRGIASDKVHQYTLSTPWDLSTASYASKSLDLSSETSINGYGLVFSTDGTKLYVASVWESPSVTDTVFEYDLSTAWDVSTGSYSGNSFYMGNTSPTTFVSPDGIAFEDDGTRMFCHSNSNVFQYDLSTAWDVSSASYNGKFYDASDEVGALAGSGVRFKDDGTFMYLLASTEVCYRYVLSTAWDVSTASYSGDSLSLNSQDSAMKAWCLGDDGEKLYSAGWINDSIYQYNLPSGSGTNEVQRIAVSGSPSAGTFTLTYSGQTTAAIAYDATAAVVDAALEALSNIGIGDVTCTNGPLPDTDVDVEFTGALQATNVAAMTASANGLKGIVTTTTSGAKSTNETVSLSTNVPAGTGTFTLSYGLDSTPDIPYDATATDMEDAFTALSSVGAGNAVFTGGPVNTAPVLVEFTGTLSTQDVSPIGTTSDMTQTSPVLDVAISTEGTSGRNEIQRISVDGATGGTWTATYSGITSSAITFDATASEAQQALEAVSTIGNANVFVTGGPLTSSPLTVEFTGTLGNTNVASLSLSSTALLNGGWAQGASKITYSNVALSSSTNVTRRQILRSKPGAAGVFYIDIDEEDVVSTEFSSTNTDDDLTRDLAVVMLDANGVDSNLSRHGIPPDYKRVVASYQNRMFYGVSYVERSMVTVSGDTATGVGTDWPNVFDDRTLYEDSGKALASINADTQTAALTESTTADQTAASATITQAAPDEQRIYHSWVTSEDSFAESVHPNQTFQVSRNSRDSEMTSEFVFDGKFYVGFKAAIYQYTFNQDPTSFPDGDGRMQLIIPRGVINNRCVAYTDDLTVIMDREGVFMFDGNTLDPVSGPIKPVFTGIGTPSIQWKNQEWFHAAYFSTQRTVRFFVTLDGGPYPRHALCFNVDQRFWWVEEYPWPITSSTVGVVDGQSVVFLGSVGRTIFTLSGEREGLSPSVTGTLRGTVTSSGSRTLTDSTAAFNAELVGSVLKIVEGTGRGQQRIITKVTSTSLTVKQHWSTRPSTDSVYQVSGVSWSFRTGKLLFSNNNQREVRRLELFWEPTSSSSHMDYQLYPDWSATAYVNKETRKVGSTDGVVTTKGSPHNKIDLTERGHVEQEFGGNRPEGVSGEKFISVSAEGVTNDEQLRLLGLAVAGSE